MDVALHRLPVTFVLDRAGVTGEDGASHNGMWDLVAPAGACRASGSRRPATPATLREAAARGGRGRRRAHRGALPQGRRSARTCPALERRGPVDVLAPRPGDSVLLVAVGATARLALEVAERCAAQGIGVTVVDPRWVVPVAARAGRAGRRARPGRHRRGRRPGRRRRVPPLAGAARRRRRRPGARRRHPGALPRPRLGGAGQGRDRHDRPGRGPHRGRAGRRPRRVPALEVASSSAAADGSA